MTAVIFVDSIGVLEGEVVAALAEGEKYPLVFDVVRETFVGSPLLQVPSWFGGFLGKASNSWMHDALMKASVDSYVAVGISAADYAASYVPRKHLFVIPKDGDFDFSSRRKHLTERINRVSKSSAGFIGFDSNDFTRARQKHVSAPLYLWNTSLEHESVTTAAAESRPFRLGVVHSENSYNSFVSAESPKLQTIIDALGAGEDEIDLISAHEAYWHQDAVSQRRIEDTIHLRFSEYTHLVFLDSDLPSVLVAKRLAALGVHVYCLPSIRASLASTESPSVCVYSPQKVSFELIQYLEGGDPLVMPRPSRKSSAGRGLPLKQIISADNVGVDLPDFAEIYGPVKSINIFVSVAPVEDRSNGARPQRIRNIFLASESEHPTVVIHFDAVSATMRLQAIEELLNQGVSIGKIYGENSTTPVMDPRAILLVGRGLRRIMQGDQCGTWFVRDLHWLDPEVDIDGVYSSQDLVRMGKIELEEMSRAMGRISSPSIESSRMFTRLLEGQPERWAVPGFSNEMPPALSNQNCVAISKFAKDDRPTFLYAGGVNSTYSMGAYLDALADLLANASASVYVDFVIREEETLELFGELAKRDIEDAPEIRVLYGDLASYLPRSRNVYGMMLLESAYGASSFPYKSVSYLELGVPIVCFEESPVHRYFGKYGVTRAIAGNLSENVALKLKELSREDIVTDFENVWNEESWSSRYAAVPAFRQTEK